MDGGFSLIVLVAVAIMAAGVWRLSRIRIGGPLLTDDVVRARARNQPAEVERRALAFGLAPVAGQEGWHGTLGGIAVSVVVKREGRDDDPITLIECPVRRPPDISLTARAAARRHPTTPPVALGDEVFEREVHAGGPRGELLALLDAGLRRDVAEAVRDGWTLQGGTWRWQASGACDNLDVTIGRGINLARRLDLDATRLTRALVERSADDPEPGVRRVALLELSAGEHAAQAVDAALTAGMADASQRVRVVAAFLKGDAATLLALADGLDAEVVTEAIEALVELHAESEVARDALTTERLIAWLDDGVRRDGAIAALGALGTPAAVARLAALRDAPNDAKTRAAARAAIRRIKARAGETGGRLALAEPDAHGAIALVDEARVDEEA